MTVLEATMLGVPGESVTLGANVTASGATEAFEALLASLAAVMQPLAVDVDLVGIDAHENPIEVQPFGWTIVVENPWSAVEIDVDAGRRIYGVKSTLPAVVAGAIRDLERQHQTAEMDAVTWSQARVTACAARLPRTDNQPVEALVLDTPWQSVVPVFHTDGGSWVSGPAKNAELPPLAVAVVNQFGALTCRINVYWTLSSARGAGHDLLKNAIHSTARAGWSRAS